MPFSTVYADPHRHRLMKKNKLLADPSSSGSWLHCGRLGSGSFGHVSLALNLVDHSLFAIKSCPSSSSSSPFLLSLLNELHILQSLRSPFILRCLGAQFNDDPAADHPPCIFLEYMDGGSLADVLRRSGGKLADETLAARFTRAILQGLCYLHQNGIVHCDIKSHNILLGSSGIKIADFGAARRIRGGTAGAVSDVKMNGMLRGTPLYMAPEVVQGVEQGPPSDIWSLGCTVVEMLQGRPPWGHISNVAALFLKLGGSQERPPLPDLVSADAKDFLQLCLQRDPKARPTAAELLQHPFVCGKVAEDGGMAMTAGIGNGEPASIPSPRSALEFLGTFEWNRSEDEPATSSMLNVGLVDLISSRDISDARRRPVSSEYKPEDIRSAGRRGQWITVRRTASADWGVDRQAGQEPQLGAVSEALNSGYGPEIRRASEVSLDSAAFLTRRRRRTVG